MKKIFLFLFLALFSLSAYSQTACDTCARAYSESVLKPVAQRNGQPITPAEHKATMQKMDNKLNAKVGEVKSGVDANSAAITNLGNQKANLTALSDTAFQIRSDFAGKADLSTVNAISDLIDSVVVGYTQIAINPAVNSTVDINSVKSSYFGSTVRNGWHGLVITSSSYVFSTTFTNLGPRKVSGTVYDANTTTAAVKNGYVLLFRYKNGVITHHAVYTNGWLQANTDIKRTLDSISQHRIELDEKANASNVFTKSEVNLNFLNKVTFDNEKEAVLASKAELAALEAAQATVEAIQNVNIQKNVDSLTAHRLALNLKADTSKTVLKGGNWATSMVVGLKTGLGRTYFWNGITAGNTPKLTIGAINPDSTSDIYMKLWMTSYNLNYERAMFNNSSAQQGFGYKGSFNAQLITGPGGMNVNINPYTDANTRNGFFGWELYPNQTNSNTIVTDPTKYGNGANLRFRFSRTPTVGKYTIRGIQFYDNISDLLTLANPLDSSEFDKGFIVSEALTGKLYSRRYTTSTNSRQPIEDMRALAFEEDIPKKTVVLTMRAKGVSTTDEADAIVIPDEMVGYTLKEIKVDNFGGGAIVGQIARPTARGGLYVQNYSFTGSGQLTYNPALLISSTNNAFTVTSDGGATSNVLFTLVFEK